MKKLSILICSLKSREAFLNRLRGILDPQLTPDVEVLTNIDDGELSIGAKRNQLVKAATGEYLCFVDDDDKVAHDYVSRILAALETKPDCVGLTGIITTNGRFPKKFIHSIKYPQWFESKDVYYRHCNHLNPIRSEIAKHVSFIDISRGEDHDFSIRIKPLLRTEVHIDGDPMYFYEFRKVK